MRRVEFGGDVGIGTRHCHSGVANKGIVLAVQLVDAVTGDGGQRRHLMSCLGVRKSDGAGMFSE
jgi:hypothetical protein